MKREALAAAGILPVLVGLFALVQAVLGVISPDIVAELTPTRSTAGPTTVPKPPVHLDKTTLIIYQDVDCWNGVPGQTCGSERTYQ